MAAVGEYETCRDLERSLGEQMSEAEKALEVCRLSRMWLKLRRVWFTPHPI